MIPYRELGNFLYGIFSVNKKFKKFKNVFEKLNCIKKYRLKVFFWYFYFTKLTFDNIIVRVRLN